jgi:hypothetical protein
VGQIIGEVLKRLDDERCTRMCVGCVCAYVCVRVRVCVCVSVCV